MDPNSPKHSLQNKLASPEVEQHMRAVAPPPFQLKAEGNEEVVEVVDDSTLAEREDESDDEPSLQRKG